LQQTWRRILREIQPGAQAFSRRHVFAGKVPHAVPAQNSSSLSRCTFPDGLFGKLSIAAAVC